MYPLHNTHYAEDLLLYSSTCILLLPCILLLTCILCITLTMERTLEKRDLGRAVCLRCLARDKI
jgi:hypothetical protein